MTGDLRSRSGGIVLEAGSLSLELAPDAGGSVASFRWRRGNSFVDLMRPMTDSAWASNDPIGAAMFPMVPYANRIDGNRFDFDGKAYVLKPNYASESLNVHGSGWLSKWNIVHAGQSAAELALDHREPAYGYSYRATQSFNLDIDRLTVEMTVTNTGDRRMPFGFGLHPWWVRDEQTRLRFEASHFWLTGPESVPTDRIATPPELDFSIGRTLPKSWRNNCYGSWSGKAEIAFPQAGYGVRMDADPIFKHLLLYADPRQTVFCLEPQTNAVCAFNRMGDEDEDLGVIVLGPDQRARGTISFAPFALKEAGLR